MDKDVLQLLYHRVLEILVWIVSRNLVWMGLLITTFWLCAQAIRAQEMLLWVLVAFVPVAMLFYEGAAGYYIHMNGSKAKKLEIKLSNPALGHELGRMDEQRQGRIAAAAGFFIPFLALFAFACGVLTSQYEKEGGEKWALGLASGLAAAAVYYGCMMKAYPKE